ncbi:hypothetical protein [Porphyrobacter sp. LM 6]|uniref:hypothetical protein n=1 Tax=Porphyrobacter sp. LM 6 TaxID=1896196 RepID=UPI00084707B3|nr:hypothetical protein [Porphyrobacter sp. LM 6]AOL95630.1 hypothetical protein BG023_112721 [Porphyrobacter sp. LM 6]
MKRIVTLIAGALALAATPAAAEKLKPDVAEAKAIELKNIVSGKAKIDPAKAYIYIKSPQNRAQGIFLKTPSPEEIANYETKWREEFAEAKADYPKDLKRYEVAKQAGRPPKEKPVEPTEESFAIDPIDLRMIVSFGPQFVFDKTEAPEKSFSYLIEVEPGEYTYLGPIMYLPGTPVFGTCFCMGSVKFQAKAGQITSLGDFLSQGWADREALEMATIEREMLADRPAKPTDWSVPESLAQYPNAKAELRAAGKRNNFLRALVGRLPPVPGVLGYDRDVPIDLVGLSGTVEVETPAATQPAEPVAAPPAPTPAPVQ